MGEEKKNHQLVLRSRADLRDNYLRCPAAERTPFQILFGEIRWRIAARTAFDQNDGYLGSTAMPSIDYDNQEQTIRNICGYYSLSSVG